MDRRKSLSVVYMETESSAFQVEKRNITWFVPGGRKEMVELEVLKRPYAM